MKKALITGITGQDGSYLSEHLLSLGYEVHGLVRMGETSASDPRFWRIAPVFNKLKLHAVAIESAADVRRTIEAVLPDECYHLAARTFVSFSFEDEQSILNTNIQATHAVLAALKTAAPHCRFFFAGSSEMFGNAEETPQTEKTRFRPRTAYGISKVAGYELTRLYRDAHGMHASSGILFNHESPRRGVEFVTRKITSHVAKIKSGRLNELKLGRTDSQRDWGHAKEYVQAMHMMLQQTTPDDYVLASGETHSVQEFVEAAFAAAGLNGGEYVKTDPKLIRPAETVVLRGNAQKAFKAFGWKAQTPFKQIVQEMVESDLDQSGLATRN